MSQCSHCKEVLALLDSSDGAMGNGEVSSRVRPQSPNPSSLFFLCEKKVEVREEQGTSSQLGSMVEDGRSQCRSPL